MQRHFNSTKGIIGFVILSSKVLLDLASPFIFIVFRQTSTPAPECWWGRVDPQASGNLVTVLLLLLGPVQLASDLSLLGKMP